MRPLSKAPNLQLLPGRRSIGCLLLQVCVHLDGLNANISLLVILCIIVYVKNKAYLSLILILARQHFILVTEKRLVDKYFSSSFSSTKLRLDRGSTLAVWEGQRAHGIHQKYLNLCSEDEQRSSILPSVKTICTI